MDVCGVVENQEEHDPFLFKCYKETGKYFNDIIFPSNSELLERLMEIEHVTGARYVKWIEFFIQVDFQDDSDEIIFSRHDCLVLTIENITCIANDFPDLSCELGELYMYLYPTTLGIDVRIFPVEWVEGECNPDHDWECPHPNIYTTGEICWGDYRLPQTLLKALNVPMAVELIVDMLKVCNMSSPTWNPFSVNPCDDCPYMSDVCDRCECFECSNSNTHICNNCEYIYELKPINATKHVLNGYCNVLQYSARAHDRICSHIDWGSNVLLVDIYRYGVDVSFEEYVSLIRELTKCVVRRYDMYTGISLLQHDDNAIDRLNNECDARNIWEILMKLRDNIIPDVPNNHEMFEPEENFESEEEYIEYLESVHMNDTEFRMLVDELKKYTRVR